MRFSENGPRVALLLLHRGAVAVTFSYSLGTRRNLQGGDYFQSHHVREGETKDGDRPTGAPGSSPTGWHLNRQEPSFCPKSPPAPSPRVAWAFGTTQPTPLWIFVSFIEEKDRINRVMFLFPDFEVHCCLTLKFLSSVTTVERSPPGGNAEGASSYPRAPTLFPVPRGSCALLSAAGPDHAPRAPPRLVRHTCRVPSSTGTAALSCPCALWTGHQLTVWRPLFLPLHRWDS